MESRISGQKIIVNQSKPILVIFSIKPFTRQSFRQNYFSREIERPKNYCESKQTYFSYILDKAFHSPEFQAKLFFTRNWVGGFYWDSLLIYDTNTLTV